MSESVGLQECELQTHNSPLSDLAAFHHDIDFLQGIGRNDGGLQG